MKYNVKDLPDECYSIKPTDKYLLKAGKPVELILIERGGLGYRASRASLWSKKGVCVNSIEQLKELNMVRFGISDDNVRQIMQDYSVMGHWGLLRILNEKEVS